MPSRNPIRSFWIFLDRYIGRGSYYWIRPLLASHHVYSYSAYAESLARLVKPGIRWLDAGCGHQILEPRWDDEERQLVSKTKFAVGCDSFLDSLQRHRSLANIVCCNLEALPFRDSSFDLLTLNMVAEHLSNPAQVFSEIARVLEPGGVVVIHTPNSASYPMSLIRLGWKIVPRKIGLKVVRFLEHRDEEDVFLTYYKANTQPLLTSLTSQAGMIEKEFRFIEGRPFFYFLAPLSVAEILIARLLGAIGREDLSAGNIIAVYERSARPFHSQTVALETNEVYR